MWHAVLDAVAATGRDDALRVLDLGGGTGGDAVRLATLGHQVTVADPSPDALASLARRAAEAGVAASSDGSAREGRRRQIGSADLRRRRRRRRRG